jgi:hypothetical protein
MATSHPAQHATGTPQQQSNDSQGAQWGHLEAIQQWLGVLGGGLLLQVRNFDEVVEYLQPLHLPCPFHGI